MSDDVVIPGRCTQRRCETEPPEVREPVQNVGSRDDEDVATPSTSDPSQKAEQPSSASLGASEALRDLAERTLDAFIAEYRCRATIALLTSAILLAALTFGITGCADLDLGVVGLADEDLPPPVDYRVLVHQRAGSPGSELTRVTPVFDAVLEHAARAPGSRVRAFALVEEGPPRAVLDVATGPLPSRPRARDRHVERFVAEQRARALEVLTPLIDAGLARSEIADAIDRVARLDPVAGADDIKVVVISDLRESSSFGRFERRFTIPTIHQVIVRAEARHLFEPASMAGEDVFVVHALLPGRRMDSSAAQEGRVRDRWQALFERAGAGSVEFGSGPPTFNATAQGPEE
ncbi:MAG: hypothetical protein WCK01_00400 [Candidatus Uhrbacteria bacterium]